MKKNNHKTFTFRYDPEGSIESMFTNFRQAVEGKLRLVKPHEISSPHIETLATSMNKNRWEIFQALVEKKPTSLSELAELLKRDYANVWRDARILEGMGIIKLEKARSVVKPRALYEKIIFDFSAKKEKSQNKLVFPDPWNAF